MRRHLPLPVVIDVDLQSADEGVGPSGDLRTAHDNIRCRAHATGLPIKQIAYESGFRQADRFRHAFREQVGVAPSTYRRIFTKT